MGAHGRVGAVPAHAVGRVAQYGVNSRFLRLCAGPER